MNKLDWVDKLDLWVDKLDSWVNTMDLSANTLDLWVNKSEKPELIFHQGRPHMHFHDVVLNVEARVD